MPELSEPFMFRRCVTAIAFSFLALAAPVAAQTTPININNGLYFENFNSMGTGTPSYPAGWNGFKFSGSSALPAGSFITTATSPAFTTNDGLLGTGTVYNYGTNGDADRALGTVASGTNTLGFGVVLVNNTGRTLTTADIEISFRMEQWRNGSSSTSDAAQEVWTFQWRTGGSSIDINDTSSDNWALDPPFNISEIRTSDNSNTAVNGNAAGNFATIGPGTLASFNWMPGDRLALRWLDFNNGGSDAGMAIDDFSFFVFDPVPEPATLAMCGFALVGLAFFRRRSQAV
jgi:trimeric autotransporter adhesin